MIAKISTHRMEGAQALLTIAFTYSMASRIASTSRMASTRQAGEKKQGGVPGEGAQILRISVTKVPSRFE